MLRNSRLLTLLGMGGLGKTRLSLQVAADVLDDYPDGVWFVELAPLAEGQRVALAVASVLGVKEEAGHPVQEALAKYVKDHKLLLVLDNCEHLLDACAALVSTLLQAGPWLEVLVTSREPLRVVGEATYHVPPLAVPVLRDVPPLEALTQCDSVRLFSDRAAAMQPAFQLTDGNATAVAAICYCLDGIPLALELAAARVRSLPVETIAERLSDRFRVLTEGAGRCFRASRPCARASTGATTCSPNRSAPCCETWPCLQEDLRWKAPRPWRRSRDRPGGCPRAVDPAGRQIPRGVRPQTASLPAAGDGAAVCARAAAGVGGAGGSGAYAAPGFLPCAGRAGGREIGTVRTRDTGSRAWTRSARTCSRRTHGAGWLMREPTRGCTSSSQCSSTGCAAACCAWATR